MTREIIDVGLYGGKSIFGGREAPLEASIVSCDKHHECSFFKEGTCLMVRAAFSRGCNYGTRQTVKGYTSRAKKYHQFKNEWESHEQYNKLKHPPEKLGIIGDTIYFPYSFIQINEDLTIEGPSFGGTRAVYIPRSFFTTDLIKRICAFRPQAIMGGEITDYQKKTVPLFLSHLKEVLPARYKAFKEDYPELVGEINYVGRKALLKTLKPSKVNYISKSYSELNQEWYWDGELLHYQKGYVSNLNMTNDYEVEQFVIRPSDKSTIKITNNDQVQDSTVFVD